MKQTPEGHPIQISSGPFDASEEHPISAMMRAAYKHGIMPHAANWRLDLEEDVVQPAQGHPIPYQRLFFFTYLPEQAMWEHKGLDETKVVNHFKDCHYLTKMHLEREVDPTSAHRVHSVQSTEEEKA